MTISLGLKISLTVFYGGVLLIGTPLNIAILHQMHYRQNSRTSVANLFLTSLLAATILSSMSGCPYYLVSLLAELPSVSDASMKSHLPACRAAIFFNYWLAACKVLSLTLLSMDRFIAIIWPYFYVQRVTKVRATLAIVIVWLQALATSLPLPIMPGWVSYIAVHGAACGYEWELSGRDFVVPVLLMDFMIPTAIIIVANISVFIVARKQKRSIRQTIRLSKADEQSRGKMLLVNTLAKAITLMDMTGTYQNKNSEHSNQESGGLRPIARAPIHGTATPDTGGDAKSEDVGVSMQHANPDEDMTQRPSLAKDNKHVSDNSAYEMEDRQIADTITKAKNQHSCGMVNEGLDASDVKDTDSVPEKHGGQGSKVRSGSEMNGDIEDGEKIEDVQIDIIGSYSGDDVMHAGRMPDFDIKRELEARNKTANKTSSPKSQVQRFLTKNGFNGRSPEGRRARISMVELAEPNSVTSFDADDFTRLEKGKKLKILSDPSSHRQQLKTLQLRKTQPSLVLSTILLVFFFLLTWLPFIISRIFRSANINLSEEMVSIPAAITNLDVILNPVVILATRKSLRRKLLRRFLSIIPLTGSRRTQA